MNEEKYCCAMRRHFLIGIIGERSDEPAPVELADFVTEWEPKILIRVKHCPFCGQRLPEDDTVRRTP